MIVFIYGTTAEAIKIAPISRRLRGLGHEQQHWVTFQHTAGLSNIIHDLGLPKPDEVISFGANGEPLKTKKDALSWSFSVFKWFIKNRKRLKNSLPKNTVVIVHGDTMTTVWGAIIGRLLGVKVAHVEAGLRSGDWRHPFPEELDRIIVGKLASIHYAPSEIAVNNLPNSKEVVFTHGNTVIDAVLDSSGTTTVEKGVGLVLLHRYEFISNSELVQQSLKAIAGATKIPVLVMVDAYSRDQIEFQLQNIGSSLLTVTGKVKHADFVEILNKAEFVITDSGGIQEEVALLGIPTLIHRMATERNEGIGRNVTLSGWDPKEIERFLLNYPKYKYPMATPEFSPSTTIVEDLIVRGF